MTSSLPLVRTVIIGLLLTPFALLAQLCAAGPVTATVDFSPPAQAKLERYGKDESTVLRARIQSAVVRACAKANVPPGITFAVTVEDIAPTRPTPEQLNASPALDPVKTHYLGGADLTGYLRDSRSQVLATVKHRYFPPSVNWRSRSFDPWADANVAIEQFADQMGAACRRVPAAG
jgi:hypothetical protein